MPFDTHFTANLPLLAILKKNGSFSRKTHLSFQKNPNIERFEKSYNFSRILRQSCYNLVEKIFTFRNVTWTNIVNAIGKNRVEKRTIWVEDFAPIFYKYGGK